MELAVGNFLTFYTSSLIRQRFQNFFIGETITYNGANFVFAPFGFSGVSVNRNGDGTEANIGLPNNELTRSWAVEAIESRWTAKVEVMALNPNDKTDFTLLHQYYGQITGGRWEEILLTLSTGGVLDAVGSDVPMRRLSQKLIGAIPTTSSVRL